MPGLGGFVANTRSAFLNPAQHTFTPPSRKLVFNSSLRTNDGLLAQHLSTRCGITYGEAIAEIKLFVDDLFHRLSSGEQVWMDKIGSLTFDKENRIQFEPDVTENYLTDSFGLVTIHSPAIRREETRKIKVADATKKQKKSGQVWRLFELIPAAAVLAILLFNPNVINKLNTGLAEIIPVHGLFFDKSSSSPEMPVREELPPSEVPPATPAGDETSLSDIPQDTLLIQEEEISLAPADSTKVEPQPVEVAAPAKTGDVADASATFHIIGGCFRIEENANKLVEEANLLGFEARVIGTNEKGLHVVSLFSSHDMNKVQEQLGEIKNSFEKGAWVLVK